MIFTEGPIYKGFATSRRAEKGSRIDFAMKPQQFFVVTDGFTYEVMSEKEVEATPKVWLASGACDTRAEAQRTLEKGLADGSYENTERPGVSRRPLARKPPPGRTKPKGP
jgi:hypothetical protein